jgi:drug/metabolite transporter (DMT)-like permease
MVYVLVSISVVAMTAAQLLLKKGVLLVGGFPQNLSELGHFFSRAYTNAYILSAVFLTIITALAWILAVSKTELSQIYPFMALSYVLVALFSLFIFKEDVTVLRWVGIIVICIGVLIVSKS